MGTEGVKKLVWNMFEQSGWAPYYLLFRSLNRDQNGDIAMFKSEEDRRREEIERLTR